MATFVSYNNANGNREDLLNIIVNITPTETPMLSGFGKSKAVATTHEWLQDSLAAVEINNVVEGSDATAGTATARTRVSNYTQINRKVWQVSDTMEVIDKAGVSGSEYSYQLSKALKEIARDLEYSIVNGTGNAGNASTARQVKGVNAWITTNTSTAGSNRALTEAIYNDLLQAVYESGGNPDVTYAAGFQKRKISAFTASQTRNIEASNKRLIASVDVYESDFGLQKIVLDRHHSTARVSCLEKSKWKIAMLRPVKAVELSKAGSSRKGMCEAEWTLEALHEGSSGQIRNLTQS
jgi:hypothetical protein